MTQKYRYNLKMIKEYLTFCYKIHSKKHFFKALSQSLSSNPNSLELWLLGVYFEFEILHNPFKARRIFLKALKINGRNFEFWKEYFIFEIRFMKLLNERRKISLKEKPQNPETQIIEVEIEPKKTKNHFAEDFISFQEIDKEGINEESYEKGFNENKEIEIIKLVYETCKEKFLTKKVCLSFLKEILKEDSSFIKEEIMNDALNEMKVDGEFAYEVYQTIGSLDLNIIKELKKDNFTEYLKFLSIFLKKEKTVQKSEIFDMVCTDFQKDLKIIYESNAEEFKNLIVGMKNILQEVPLLYKRVNKFIEENLPKEIILLESYFELLSLEIKKSTEKINFLMKFLRAKIGSFKKDKKAMVLTFLVSYMKEMETKEKIFLEFIFSIAIDNFLLFPKDLASILKEFLMNITVVERNDFYHRIIKYKRACPLEVWLQYLEEMKQNLNYKEKRDIFRRLESWFPNDLTIKIQQKKFEEDEGNYVEAQRISFEINQK